MKEHEAGSAFGMHRGEEIPAGLPGNTKERDLEDVSVDGI
jgi:hypothetical protein